MRLILAKLFNTSVLVSPTKAIRLYKIIAQRIKYNKPINIDFLGIQATTIAFLYIVVSNLIKECEKNVKDLKSLIYISNPSPALVEEMEYLETNYKKIGVKLDSLNFNYI